MPELNSRTWIILTAVFVLLARSAHAGPPEPAALSVAAQVLCHGADGPLTFTNTYLQLTEAPQDHALDMVSTEGSGDFCGLDVKVDQDSSTAYLTDSSAPSRRILLGKIHLHRYFCVGNPVDGVGDGAGSSPTEPGTGGPQVTVQNIKVRGCTPRIEEGTFPGIPITSHELLWDRTDLTRWTFRGPSDGLTLEMTSDTEYKHLFQCLSHTQMMGRWNRSCRVTEGLTP